MTLYQDDPSSRWIVEGDVFASYVDAYKTVQPGEIHTVWGLPFKTPRAGVLMLDFNGVEKKVTVLP